MGKEHRGFASMDPARRREIAAMGGRACHEKGTGHEWTSQEAREAGRKGGMSTFRRKRQQQQQQRSAQPVEQDTATADASSPSGVE